MPKTLAEGRDKLTALETEPTNLAAIPADVLNAGIDLSCVVLASDFQFGFADSDRVGEKALCDTGNVEALGSDNFTAAMQFFRYLDSSGQSDTQDDVAYELFDEKGKEVWVVHRVGPTSSTAWAAGDEYVAAKLIADNHQPPAERTGYIKFRVGFAFAGAVRGITAASS